MFPAKAAPLKMAAKKAAKRRFTDEALLNRWNLDFYLSKALDAFRKDEYTEFCEIRNILQSLLARPVEGSGDLTIKLFLLQFLSRINDGDKLDVAFESEGSETPLESALAVLESICAEVDVPQNNLERVHTAIKEMLVVVCIKSQAFAKAKEMLQKHFPREKDQTVKTKMLWNLVKSGCSDQSVLMHPSYSQFRQDMLDFIERVYTIPQPFLSKLLSRINNVAFGEPRTGKTFPTASPENNSSTTESHSNHSNSLQTATTTETSSEFQSQCRGKRLSLNLLMKVYAKLQQSQGVQTPFSELYCGDSCLNELNLRLTETPVEMFESADEGGSSQAEPHEEADRGQEFPMDTEPAEAANAEFKEARPQADLVQWNSKTDSQSLVADHTGPSNAPNNSDGRAQTPPPSARDTPRNTISSQPVCAPGFIPTRYCTVNVAQLVLEDDSHVSESEGADSQKSTSMTRPELECPSTTGVLQQTITPERVAQHPPEATSDSETTEPNPPHRDTASEEPFSSMPANSPPVRKRRVQRSDKRNMLNVSGVREDWSDEECLFECSASASRNSYNKGRKRKWTDEESEWVKQGVGKFGEGKWEKIRNSYPFKDRTAVNIKDRWRTMKKNQI
ncbi:telomeric repeat binding factor a isoform X2 [Denticeps clupeoides]|uniref:telomeric repeat binding factor a isoform X2 n=1 Tax=Denticeps clupeoides TaxID=299321 RepID=UPI0010A2EFFB|nr:telomeric repeat-binding factor 2-like isoform X2 [Denticeps clupeoides]